MSFKPCTKCGVEQPLDCYDLHPRGLHGRHARCKACRAEDRRRETPAAVKSRADKALREQGLKQCSKCGEIKDRAAGFYTRKKTGFVSAMCRSCDIADTVARQASDYAKASARAKAWRVANPERARAIGRKGRSTRRAILMEPFVEHVDHKVSYETHGGMCGICKGFIEGSFEVDHIVPLSRGGDHSYANTQPAHPRCNHVKGNRVLEASS